jgi:S-adenosylmethionine decarboxylase proenzyme
MDVEEFLLPSQTMAGLGVHLLAEWYGCNFAAIWSHDVKSLRTVCLSTARAAGLQVVGDAFHQFEPHGVTGTVLLAESHLAIHTWPETGFVTLDIYVCNYQTDNTNKALNLYGALRSYFKPVRENFSQVSRGDPGA